MLRGMPRDDPPARRRRFPPPPIPTIAEIRRGCVLGLVLLHSHRMHALGADGSGPLHDPLGHGRLERQASPMRPVFAVRDQGRDPTSSVLGQFNRGGGAVSGLAHSTGHSTRSSIFLVL